MQEIRPTYQSLALWLLRLYPRRWRGRYEVEVRALLEVHEIRLRTAVDLLIGALDARLDPAYAQERSVLTMRSPRFTTVALFGAFALFGIALMLMVGTLLDPDVEQNVPTNYEALVAAYPLVSTASSVILVASLLAGVALLATFLVLTLGRISDRRTRSAVAVLVIAVVVALVVFAPNLLPGGGDLLRQFMPMLLGVVVSLGGIGAALTRAQLGMTQWRALLVAAASTTLAMLLIAIGAITWLVTVLLHASLIHFSYGLGVYIGDVSALALATVIAVVVVSRAVATRWRQNPIGVATVLPLPAVR
jgi:hypothetical protein